jgi:hypothetical protein
MKKMWQVTETCKSRHGGLNTVKPQDQNRDQQRSVSNCQNSQILVLTVSRKVLKYTLVAD